MKQTFQFEKQSVLQHGESVYDIFNKIKEQLNGSIDYKINIPQSIIDYKDKIIENLYSDDIIKEYTIMHDCGKPFCKVIDSDGKQHFPDHAKKSYDVYLSAYNDSPNKEIISKLILEDMDLHLLKDEGIKEFCKKDIKIICTQILVTLAEIESNCKMFGGYDSTSYKIKFKSFTQRTKKILQEIFCSI
jgi:hypothetical protein